MRIATKQTAVLGIVVLSLLAGNAVWRLRVDAAVFDEDMARYHHTMGRGLGAAVAEIWSQDGEARALWLVTRANERESGVTIRWVWPDGSREHHHPLAPDVSLAALEAGDDVNWTDAEGAGRLITYVPVHTPSGIGAIEITEVLDRKWRVLAFTRVRILVVTAAVLLSATLVVAGLGHWLVTRPARRLTAQATRVGQGDLSTRLVVDTADELGVLASEMNAMCDRLAAARRSVEEATSARIEAVEQMRRMDRMGIVGEIASGLAHELGTPLNVVAGHARMIAQGEVEGGGLVRSAEVIDEQASRMTRILRSLLDFARGWKPETAREELGALVAHVASLVEPLARRRGVRIERAGEGAVHAVVDSTQIEQVVTNLLVNALDASASGAVVRWSVGVTEAPPALAFVDIVDEGRGIAPDDVARLFEPFFSTKAPGEGTGLGLPISLGIVREHGGRIDVTSTLGQGTRFRVLLPLEESAP